MNGAALAAVTLSSLASLATWRTYNFLSGRTFVRDNLYRARLSSRSLPAWDAHAAARHDRSDIVVCLTTIPTRIHALAPTLASLCAQDVLPARIRVHVPHTSRRESVAYVVPDWLTQLRMVEVVRTEDFGPATKLLPALAACAPEQRLLVVDDDKLYPPTLIRDFAQASAREPNVAWGASGWIAPADLIDRPTTLMGNLLSRPPVPIKATRIRAPRCVDVLQGYSGYLVRPRFFDLAALCDYRKAPPAAFFADDVWISAHCNVPKQVLPMRRYCIPVLRHALVHARTAISLENRGAGDPSRRANTLVLQHFAARFSGARRR